MLQGLIVLPWWGYLIVLLVLTHLTIVSVTVFLHRAQAHRALTLHPAVSHCFRFWLWLTTSMVTREWVAVHRKHHSHCETEEDPHSPQVRGISRVLWQGAELYRAASQDSALVQRYGQGTPDDWLERRLYSRHPNWGPALMLVIDLGLFGALGLTVWALQMAWIPFWAAGVINGLGHWAGYRNFETADASRNLVPLAILVGGEELHNNHHAGPASARMSCRWFELDIGWMYIRLLAGLGLARVNRQRLLGPVPRVQKLSADPGHRALPNRFQVLSLYGKRVLLPLLKQERRGASRARRQLLGAARWIMQRERRKLDRAQQGCLEATFSDSLPLATAYEFRLRLVELWQLPGRSSERLRVALNQWCDDARQTGISALVEFADTLLHSQQAGLMPARA